MLTVSKPSNTSSLEREYFLLTCVHFFIHVHRLHFVIAMHKLHTCKALFSLCLYLTAKKIKHEVYDKQCFYFLERPKSYTHSMKNSRSVRNEKQDLGRGLCQQPCQPAQRAMVSLDTENNDTVINLNTGGYIVIISLSDSHSG